MCLANTKIKRKSYETSLEGGRVDRVRGGKMSGRYVIRLHYINVKPSRDNFNLKMSLKGYSIVVDHWLTCTRFYSQPSVQKKKKDRESTFTPPTNDRFPSAVPCIPGSTVSFLIAN